MTEEELIAVVQAAIDPLDAPLDGQEAWDAVCAGLRAEGYPAPSGLGFRRTDTDKVMVSYRGHNGIEVTHA